MMKILNRVAILSMMTGLLCSGFWACPSLANACCVYNNTTYPLHVEIGATSWDIQPSNHRCTNGYGGYAQLYVKDAFGRKAISYVTAMDVDDHGWISVYKKKSGKWKAVSKKQNGSVKSVKYIEPLK
jgi:hypothetical protein